jgi:hypothetical protein
MSKTVELVAVSQTVGWDDVAVPSDSQKSQKSKGHLL